MKTRIEENGSTIGSIITVLELQLKQLDALGAHIAAAHLDAAIQHLRISEA